MVTAAANVPPVLPAQLRALVRRLRWRRRRTIVGGALLRAALVLAVPAVALAWLFPAAVGSITLVAASLLLVAALGGLVSARGAKAALLRGIEQASVAAGVLADLDDELRTWLEYERSTGSPAMLGWLGNDVSGRLAALPADALRPIGRRSPGRLWWLLPLLLLVLLAWWLSWWLAPPWPGALGGAANRPDAGAVAGGDAGADGGGGRGESGRPEPPPPAREEAPPPAPMPPPPGAATPPPDDEPSPLLALPEQQHFVLPEFIDDGPTRRARMRAAELEAGAPQQPAAARGSAGEAPPPPPAREEVFTRAAEAAQRARHVPPSERAMVRRFFDRLRAGGQ